MHGIPIRKAQKIVSILLDILQTAVAQRENVPLPGLGTLSICKSPLSRRLWRLNKIVTQYKDRYRIVFKPDESW